MIKQFEFWPQKPIMSDEQQALCKEKENLKLKLFEIQTALENFEFSPNLEKIIDFNEVLKKLKTDLNKIYTVLKKYSSDFSSLNQSENEFSALCDSFEKGKMDFCDIINEAHQYCEALMVFTNKIITPIDNYHKKRNTRLLGIVILIFLILASIYGFLHRPLTPFEHRMSYISKFETAKNSTIRIIDLSQIAKALEVFYKDNQHYPISQNSTWISVKTEDSKNGWIPGLVPKHMIHVPVDPQLSSEMFFRQYIYKSDGKNYKLLSHETDEIHFIKNHYPQLVDPKRENYSFGFWSIGARDW